MDKIRGPLCWYCGREEDRGAGYMSRPDPLCFWDSTGFEAGWLHVGCAKEVYRALSKFAPLIEAAQMYGRLANYPIRERNWVLAQES